MKLFALLAYFATVVSSSQLLLPLYIYPSASAWEPVYNAIAGNPSVQFVIIVNVNSGPGNKNVPAAWTTALGNLTRYSNVRTVGYVYTNYGRRAINSVQADIATYAGWSPNIAVDGIFFDEVSISSSNTRFNYMSTAANYVRSSISGATVLFNMGERPETTNYYNICDGIVVFENYYSQYRGQASITASVPAGFASKSGIIIHDFKSSLSTLRSQIHTLKVNGLQYIYFTSSPSYNSVAAPAAIGDVANAIATA